MKPFDSSGLACLAGIMGWNGGSDDRLWIGGCVVTLVGWMEGQMIGCG